MNDITKIKVNGDPESSYQLYPRNEEFAKRAGGNTGSQSGVQSDWNQNDSTATDYVKNRPFYDETVETEIIPETAVTFSEKSGLMAAVWPESFDLVDGQTYTISWDGTDYACTGILFNGAVPILGNLGIFGFDNDTGEPFIFTNEGQWLVTSTESATEHIISISAFDQGLVKIDEKYLPEATNISSGVTKIQVRNLDTTKSYSTEEIEEIYQSVRAGTAIYLTYGTVIAEVSYSRNDSFAYKLFNGQENTIHPVDGVWDFTNTEITYQNEVLFNSQYRNYPANIYCDADLGGNEGSKYQLVRTNTDGFRGDYVQADNAIVLKLKNNTKYLYVQANKNGEIEVTKRDSGLTSGGDITTIFQNGDDSMILKSSTAGSTKKFKITVDDSGTLTATEVT